MMNIEDATREFQIRYYHWAASEFEREIEESFPGFSSFKHGTVAQTAQLLRRLDKAKQRVLAGGLLKRFHPDAVEALGEVCSKEEERLVSQRDSYCNMSPLCPAAELVEPGVTRLAGKAKLRKTILKQFKEAFGSQCFDLASVGMDPDLDFKMKYDGWILTTHFEFHGRSCQMQYWSHIISPTEGRYGGPAMDLDEFISFTGWLGLSGTTTREWLTEKDIEPACAAAIGFCQRFFDAAPKLLKGLEFGKITPGRTNP
jgi:hypothetical protein